MPLTAAGIKEANQAAAAEAANATEKHEDANLAGAAAAAGNNEMKQQNSQATASDVAAQDGEPGSSSHQQVQVVSLGCDKCRQAPKGCNECRKQSKAKLVRCSSMYYLLLLAVVFMLC